MNLHFISGLPRSGSTLLAAIMRQNPRVTAGMSSPVASLYRAMEDAMAQKNEGAVFVTDEQRRAILRGVFESFYASDAFSGAAHFDHDFDRIKCVFDTNRMWMTRISALALLFPQAKMICCVRDLGWIVDSFERLYRRNPFEPSGIYGYDTGGTVYSRSASISGGSGVVGYALNGLREVLAGEHNDRVLLVEYEGLCRAPAETLAQIYAFLGLPSFVHDFSHVEYSASEFDRNIGARGLHDVGGAVEWRPRKTILPPELFASYENDQFWRSVITATGTWTKPAGVTTLGTVKIAGGGDGTVRLSHHG